MKNDNAYSVLVQNVPNISFLGNPY